MGNNIPDLTTDADLLKALREAASKKLSPQEMLEQRASFVYGSISSKSGVTRQHIKQVIAEQEGIEIE